MKKLFLLLLMIFIVSIVASNAGYLYNLDFDNESEGFVVSLFEKDAIRFNFMGKDNKLVIDKILPEKNNVAVTLFIEGANTPAYLNLNNKTLARADFDKDGTPDLFIGLYQILNTNAATLAFKKVNKSDPYETKQAINKKNEVNINPGQKKESKKIPKKTIAYGIIIVAAIVLFWINSNFFEKKKSKKSKKAS